MEPQEPKNGRLDGPARRVVRRATKPAKPNITTVDVTPDVSVVQSNADAHQTMLPDPKAAPLRRSRWHHLTHWSAKKVIVVMTLLLATGVATIGLKVVMASQRIVTKNVSGGAPVLQGEVDPTKLKGEGDGRINILLLGVGGETHDGGKLSDTIMVASIDPINKTIAMLSIPRDLYVKIPGYGYSKINAANSYGGPDLAKQVVSNVLDLPIHYYAQVDFSGFKQAVDAVGGVDITSKASLYDSQYPCDNNRGYCPFNLPVGAYHMDGTLALKYSRCRHGSCGNDFGRAARQQEVLVALRQKTLEASTLTNPLKVSGLIDSVGDHVRTDMQLAEMQKMAKIIKDVDISKAVNKVLDDTPGGLLVEGGGRYAGAGSILLPRAGDFNYNDIQELAHSIFVDGYLKKENATVQIQNGTLKPGIGAAVSKQLTAYNYNVIGTITAATQDHQTTILIDHTNGKKPYTIQYLEQRFGVTAQKQVAAPVVAGQPAGPDIDIIVGNDYNLSAASTSAAKAITTPTTTTTTR